MKKFLVSLLVISAVVISIPSNASATEIILDSNNVANVDNIATISPLTLYDWSVSTYMDTSYRKVPGPSGNNGNFNLRNADFSHYKTLTVSWTGSESMYVYLYNIGTKNYTSVKSSSYAVSFTDLVAGNYTVYARKAIGSGSKTFKVTTSNATNY